MSFGSLIKSINKGVLIIDCDKYSKEEIIKNIPKYKLLTIRNKITFINTDDEMLKDISNALNIHNRKERLEFVYDSACNYLDTHFYGHNVCEFKNDKCPANIMHLNCHQDNGCCYNIYHEGLCKYLGKDGHCTIKCLPCKKYTCKYLKSKGIKFRYKDLPILDYFLTPRQKFICEYTIYTPKEIIIKKMLGIGW